jgi:DNA-directed RNA polymerase subunit RPC12/RpoP
MALVACKECKKEISDQASACPYCGLPAIPVRRWFKTTVKIAAIAVVLFVAYALIFPVSEEEARYLKVKNVCESITKGQIVRPGYCEQLAREAAAEVASKE